MSATLRKGDHVIWMAAEGLVKRVARDGSWADIQWFTTARPVLRIWTKRHRLPLPDGAVVFVLSPTTKETR